MFEENTELCTSIYSKKAYPETVSRFYESDLSCFYGSYFGSHYSTRIRLLFDAVVTATVAFGRGYSMSDSNVVRNVLSATLFAPIALNKSTRAHNFMKEMKTITPEFASFYWGKTEETSRHMAKFVSPIATVNQRVRITTKAFVLDDMTINPPENVTFVRFRLISYAGLAHTEFHKQCLSNRNKLTHTSIIYEAIDEDPENKDNLLPEEIDLLKKMVLAENGKDQPKATPHNATASPTHTSSSTVENIYDGLLIHFHGGGFIGQSSRSHQIYLRKWSKQLRLIIISVDYTLAPKGRFPRAADECFYVYAWARKNKKLFGCSEKAPIFVSGDSAGGNLAIAVSLKSIRVGITPPDGIHANYAVTNLTMSMSPSRLLSAMDGLLTLHILQLCLKSYAEAGLNEYDFESPSSICSPWNATDEELACLPPIYMTACELDPLLDDSVDFSRRLKQLHVSGKRMNLSKFAVLRNCPHGFLNLLQCGDDAVLVAEAICFEHLKEMLEKGKQKNDGV